MRRATSFSWMTRAFIGLFLAASLGGVIQSGAAQEQTSSAEEKREQVAAERFLELLLRRPTTGTALDRVFGYHVGRGDIGDVIAELTGKAQATSDADEAGRHWMVVGLLQLQRSEDAVAADALQKAESQLPDNSLAAYYHGQALLLVGKTNDAADAMQRAIDLKPPRRDYLNIAGQLGRLYQRAGKVDDALRIWKELEESFPGDDGVRQRIARILVEEGDTEAALARYDALAKDAKSQNDRIVFALRAADLRVRRGNKDQAISELEDLLARLRPGSYLYDEARRRIEAAFLSSGDYAGLAGYYQKWVQEHPDDIGAVLRLARTLSVQGRGDEALSWFEKAIERAPSGSAPRLALVDAYIAQERFADAAEQYETLVEMEPNNPDYLVRWGQVLIEDRKQPKQARTKAAADVWKRLAESRSDDAAIQSQVADLLRGAELVEDALDGYRVAIKLAPDQPQYKEYLGEYLHRLDRTEEATKVWRSLAEGELRTRENVVRLAEVLHQFDRANEALKTMAEACEMDPTIDQRLRYADWLRDAEQYDQALEQIKLAGEATDTFDDRDRVFTASVQTYQASGQLEERIEQARGKAEKAETDSELWRRLSVLLNANRQTPEALDAIEKAVEQSPDSIEALDIAARMYEEAGRLRMAVEKRKKLAESDQRFRGGHLQRLASLHLRMGQTDEAVTAGKELLASSAGSIEAYQFYADLCGQIGRIDERLDTLRRCVRMNPRSTEAQQMLASQLAEDFKTDQAVELYWKMLDSANEIEDSRDVVKSLADLYLRTNRLDQLISRLEIRGRESGDRRTTIDLISTAHQQAGDLGLAREALEGLLREGGRDTLLLERLVALAEQAGEYDEAVQLQRQLARLAPGRKSEARLASLLIDIGAVDEAQAMWLRLTETNADPQQMARNINRLFAAGEIKMATVMAAKILEENPDDWETRLQLMVLQADDGDWESSAKTADDLIAMDVKDTTLPAGGKPYKRTVRLPTGQTYQQPPLRMMRLQNMYPLLQIVDERYGYQPTTSLPKPTDFGHAKLMARYCQLKQMQIDDGENVKELVSGLEEKAMVDGASLDQVWQWYETLSVVGLVDQTSSINYQNPKDWAPLWRLMEVDRQLGPIMLSQMFVNRSRYAQRGNIQLQKLSDERLQWLKDRVESASEDNAPLNVYGLATSWVDFYGSELRIAGREVEADAYLKEQLAKSLENAEPTKLAAVLQQASAYGTDDQLWPLIELALDDKDALSLSQTYGSSPTTALMAMFASKKRVDDELSKGPADPEYRRRVISLMDRVIKQEVSKPVRRRTIRLTGVGGPRRTYRIVGGNYQSIQVEFPPKGLGPNDEFVRAQHGAWELMKDHADEWIKDLQSKTAEDVDPRLKVWRQLTAATLLQWQKRTSEAIKQLAEATTLAADQVSHMEPELRLMSADLLLRQDRQREALEAIDSLAVYDQNTMSLREFAAARLAAALGDRERAQNAARRLFGVRLNTDAQIELAKLMRKLDMRELASDLVRRMRSRGGSSTDQLQSLMTYFVAQEEGDQAAEVAMELLRRSAPARRPSSNFTTSNQVRRRNALQTLATTGRLTSLIAATEKRLANAPKSQRIRSELSEMYTAAGKTAKSQELLGKTDLDDVNSARALETTAQQLVAAGKMDQACEAYLKLLRRKQDTFDRNFYEVKRPFDQTKRLGDLADLIIEVGVEKFRDYRVSEICQSLIREQEDIDKARQLYLATLGSSAPSSNSMQAMSRIMGSASKLLTNPETVKKTADYMIEASVAAAAGQTLFNGYSTSSDGRHNNATTYLVRHVADSDENSKIIEDAISAKLDEEEDWQEGKIWLGILLTARKRFDEAKELLEPLLSKEMRPAPTHDMLWLVGSLIDAHPPMHDLALRIYEHAMENTTDRSNRDFKYSLKGRVCKFMVDIGDKKRARDMAIDSMKKEETSTQQRIGNAEYEAYQKIRSTLSMIDFLTEIDYPSDALRVVREFDRSLFVTAGRYQRTYKDQFEEKQQKLLDDVRELGGLATVATMINPKTDGSTAVDFGITLGDRPFTKEGLASLWVDLIEEAADDPEQAEALTSLVSDLKSLASERSSDDSAAAAYAISADIAGDRGPLRELVDRWTTDDESDSAIDNVTLRNRLLMVALLRLDRATSAEDSQTDLRADRKRVAKIEIESTSGVSPTDAAFFLARLGRQALARDEVETAKKLWQRVASVGANQWLLLDLSHAAINAGMTELSSAAAVAAASAPVGEGTGLQDTQVSTGSLGQLLGSAQPRSTNLSSSNQNEPDPQEVRLARRILELDDAWRKKKLATKFVFDPLVALTVGPKGAEPRPLCTPVEVKTDNRFVIDSVFDRLAKRAHWTKRADQLLKRLSADSPTSNLLAGLVLLRDERGKEASARYQAIDPSALKALPKELVLQSLLLALEDPDCRIPAMQLSLALVDHNRPTQRYQDIKPYETFLLMLAQTAMTHDMKQEFVSTSIKDYLEFTAHDNDRYSGSSGTSRRVGQLEQVARLLLPKGRLEEALKYLAMRQSVYALGFDRTNDWVGLSALQSLDETSDRKAAYQMLADWTFRGDGPLRMISALARRQPLPEWIPESVGGRYPEFPTVADSTLPIVTNYYLLAMLADETGATDDLLGRFEEARAKERAGTATGLAIVLAALEKPVEAELLASIEKRLQLIKPGEDKPKTAAPIAEFQLASILAQDPQQAEFAKRVTQSMYEHTHPSSRGYLMPWYARFQHARGWAETSDWKSADQLAHWLRSTIASVKNYSEGKTPPIWVTDGAGRINHVCGFGGDYLWLRYPLQGNFIVEAEFSDGGWSESSLCCDGLRFSAFGNGSYVYLKTPGTIDWVRYDSKAPKKNEWNRCSISVDDKFLSYYVNDTLIYREERKGSAPWIALSSDGDRRTSVRSIAITGEPKIPREVNLIPEDNLRGWTGYYYGLALPSGEVNHKKQEKEASEPRRYRTGPKVDDLGKLAWTVADGELISGNAEKRGKAGQSCIRYERPLGDGETISYEFYYEEGKTEVHPSIGRTAYLFRPNGLHLHWMTETSSTWKLPDDNEVLLPDEKPSTLPLKSGEWNQVELKRDGKRLQISLNGEMVFDRDPETRLGDMVFGLFHNGNATSARVRRMTLSGPWPEQLPGDLSAFRAKQ